MRSPRFSLKRSLLLAGFIAITTLSATASAQDTSGGNNNNNGGDRNNNQPTATGTQTSNAPANTNTNTNNSNNNRPSPETTSSPSAPGQKTATISNTNTATGTQTGPTSLPNIPGGNADSTSSLGLPSLSRTTEVQAVPTYPPPAVPPTENAPFMQHSTAPEGTVFIAVGAILGAFGLTVLIWRAVVAWLLHRSVERAAMLQHAANDKAASFPAPPAPFYKSPNHERDSSPNLLLSGGGAGASSTTSLGRGVRRTNRGPIPSSTPSQSNLFYSPTAATGGGLGGGNNRDSRFLPSGFYATAGGNASPTGPRHEHSISLSNLRPDSRGHARTVSPPDSPNMGPMRATSTHGTGGMVGRNMSTSSLNLNHPPSGRAPSAYLDDMLDDPSAHTHMMPPPSARPMSQFSSSPSPGPRGHTSSPGGRF